MDGVHGLHSSRHVTREMTMDDPGARIIAQHLHGGRGRREDFHDVTSVHAVCAEGEGLAVEVNRVVVEGGPQTKQVPGHHVPLPHHQAVDVAEDSAVDGVHAVAFFEVGFVQAVRAPTRGSGANVFIQVPTFVFIEDGVEHPEIPVHVTPLQGSAPVFWTQGRRDE